jgi:HAE1 family hydrophobic/amphiphilic exporter-1
LLRAALRHRAITLIAAFLALVGSFALVTRVKTEFLPPEDRAQFNLNVELPTGTSLEATQEVSEAVAKDVREHAPSVLHTLTTIGGGAQGQVNLAQIQVVQTPSKQRKFSRKADGLGPWDASRIRRREHHRPGDQRGRRGRVPVPARSVLRTGSDMDQLVQVTDALKKELSTVKGLRRSGYHLPRWQAGGGDPDRSRARG